MNRQKRTEELLVAFSNIKVDNLQLLLIGSLSPDIEPIIKKYVQADQRVKYLGWKSSEELEDYLCAGDLYIQPGSQSVLMQIAICSGCAVAIFPHKSHKHLLQDRAFYIDSVQEIENTLLQISSNRNTLDEKRKESFEFAKSRLDYKKLASYIYERID